MHATLLITDCIQRAIEEGQYSCGIFLDFSKAFYTVNHSILLKKLSHYGIRGIANQWFASYLSNRRASVIIGKTNSKSLGVPRGVPQGSVLGPLLFLIYIKDFYRCSQFFNFHIFADDINLFACHISLQTLEKNTNENLIYVSNWLTANKLSLNIDKTNFVLFHLPQKATNYNIRLVINDQFIKKAKCIKYLGILIHSHLSWKQQILHISKKVKRCVGVLSKVRHYVNAAILSMLYYSLICPFLTYAVVTWGSTYTTTSRPLIILQKRAVRLMTFSEFRAHSDPIFHVLGLLKLPDIIFLHNALFMFDFYSDCLPSVFNCFFLPVNRIHQYNTRLAAKRSYYLPRIRTNYGKFNIRYLGVKIWNSISEQFKSKPRSSFKKFLVDSFIDTYNN